MTDDPVSPAAIDRLIAIIARLRDPRSGCPWDLEQDFRSIVPYTLEEAYEVVAAVEQGEIQALCGELGDLLFQVVFLARLADEAGHFDFADVIRGICDKMIRRHPHVFAGERVTDVADQSRAWERHKDRERGERHSLMDDVPHAMPALTRAEKLQKRAARIGLDWSTVDGPLDKVREELRELELAIAGQSSAAEIQEEAGDLLFAAVNVLRHAGIDPEAALRRGNGKFERRIREVERRCRADGVEPALSDPGTLDRYWREVKLDEPAVPAGAPRSIT